MIRELSCRLCEQAHCRPCDITDERTFYLCSNCGLLFVDPVDYLDAAAEKRHYDLHQNSPADVNYRYFLSQLTAPLIERLSAEAQGLDFGSGPGPTVSIMLADAGFPTTVYDVFYANDPAVLGHSYDFITMTEVVEHLHQPSEVLHQLWGLLKPDGYLAIMTQRWDMQPSINSWRYKNDPTHVIFFSQTTFNWLAGKWGAAVEYVNRNVTLLQKK